MNSTELTRRLTDQISYNLLYAPDYPQEDQTSIEREESVIRTWLSDLLSRFPQEDKSKWYKLGESSILAAFRNLKNGKASCARKEFESAIDYLRNAAQNKAHKVDFMIDSDGSIVPPDKSQR